MIYNFVNNSKIWKTQIFKLTFLLTKSYYYEKIISFYDDVLIRIFRFD